LTNLFGPRTYVNTSHLNITSYRRFDLQPKIRECNPVVKRDPTVFY